MGDLLSTVVGGMLTLVGGYAAKIVSDQREERSIRSAFAGELRALLTSLDSRNFLPRLEINVVQLNDGKPVEPFTDKLPARYNTVFNANAVKLGVLRSPFPERVVTVYAQLASLEDRIELNKDNTIFVPISGPYCPNLDDLNRSRLAHEKLRKIFLELRNDIRGLVDDLEDVTTDWQSKG